MDHTSISVLTGQGEELLSKLLHNVMTECRSYGLGRGERGFYQEMSLSEGISVNSVALLLIY